LIRLIKHKKNITWADAMRNIFLDAHLRQLDLHGLRYQHRLRSATSVLVLLFYQSGKNYTGRGIWYCIWDFSKRPRKSHVFGLYFKNADIKKPCDSPMRSTHFWSSKKKIWWPRSFLYEYYPIRPIWSIGIASQWTKILCRLWGRKLHTGSTVGSGSNLGGKLKLQVKKYI